MSLPSWGTFVYFDGVNPTDVSAYVVEFSIRRGRSSPLDQFSPGTYTARLDNYGRTFDPLHASGPYFGGILPGRRVVQQVDSVTVFDGRIADFSFDVGPRASAVIDAEDGLAKLGRASFDEWTTTNGDLPGVRLAAALARPEIGYTGTTSLDAGLFPLAGDLVTHGSNALAYLQLVVETDLGYLFVDRSGVLQFVDRHAFVGATPAVTFADDGTGIEVAELRVTFGQEELFNRVSVDRVQPLTAAEDPEPAVSTDATSITTHDGVFSLDRTEQLLQDDTTASDVADYLLSVYKDPLLRFSSVALELAAIDSGDRVDVLELDIASVVSVVHTPDVYDPVGTAISRTCIVEGVRLTGSADRRSLWADLTLGDAAIAQTGGFWTVEDATFGVINGGTGIFNYPVAF